MLWSLSSRRHGEGQALHGHRRIGVYRAAGLLGVVRGVCVESLAHPAPNQGVQATPYSLRSFVAPASRRA
jgi:hypothetical protein